MLWLALYLPDLPLQVHTRGLATDDPLVTFSPAPRSRVVAANAPAQAAGIRPGTGLASALALVPALLTRPRDEAAEAALLTELAGWAGQFTPQLTLDAPECVLLDVSRSLMLFGGIARLMTLVERGAAALGLRVITAAAPTPLAARWLALAGGDRIVREAHELPARLGPLPLRVMQLGEDITALLESVGISTIGQCLRLPRDALAKRQAQALTQALVRALGERPDPRPPFVPPPEFHSRLELPWPCAHTEPLMFGARRLLAALAGQLAARQAGIEHYALHLEHEDAAPTVLEVYLGVISRDEARCCLLAQEHLAALQLAAPVCAISLHATRIQVLAGDTPSLFGEWREPRHDAEARSLLVERLRARLGRAAVFSVAAHADHRPERATQEVAPLSKPRPSAEPGNAPPPLRPLWLLPEPRPLDGLGALQLVSGPERIEAGWWDGADISRDYHIALGARRQLLWLYRETNESGRWFVHGLFA